MLFWFTPLVSFLSTFSDKIVDEFMIEFMSILQDNHKKDR